MFYGPLTIFIIIQYQTSLIFRPRRSLRIFVGHKQILFAPSCLISFFLDQQIICRPLVCHLLEPHVNLTSKDRARTKLKGVTFPLDICDSFNLWHYYYLAAEVFYFLFYFVWVRTKANLFLFRIFLEGGIVYFG